MLTDKHVSKLTFIDVEILKNYLLLGKELPTLTLRVRFHKWRVSALL